MLQTINLIEELEEYSLSTKRDKSAERTIARAKLGKRALQNLIKLADKLEQEPLWVLTCLWQNLIHHYTSKSRVVVGIGEVGQANIIPFLHNFTVSTHLRSQLNDLLAYLPKAQSSKELIHYLKSPNPHIYKHLVMQGTVNVNKLPFKQHIELIINLQKKNIIIYYQSLLFDKKHIKEIIYHFELLLIQLLKNPNAPTQELSLVSTCEKKQLQRWNNTASAYNEKQCLPELFAKQVKKNPNTLAVIAIDTQLSYAELDKLSTQLAHHLISIGISREKKVAVCLQRKSTLLITLLAILKAGGTYIPFDPSYPTDRLVYMLNDSQPSVFIGEKSTLNSLPPFNSVHYLDINDLSHFNTPSTPLKIKIIPSQLAYILYTSGSTGNPKGVAISHASVNAMLHWGKKTYTATELKRVLAGTSICFDLSVYELFLTLTVGGCVVLTTNPLHRVEWEMHHVTLINTVPSVMKAFLHSPKPLPNSIKVVNLAGEPLQPALAQAIYRLKHIKKLYNLYGPTEDTTYSTFSLISRNTKKPITIGKILHNSQAYILNHYLQRVGIGMVGELYLGGKGLARCYLNRPDLTAEKFIPNPFAKVKGTRLYKTGDLCRYLPNGEIEYLGRIDHQVKIRGFRIELGEIENQLAMHPKVKDAIVMVNQDSRGNKLILAYITGKKLLDVEQKRILNLELKVLTQDHLPHFMQPHTLFILDSLPHTPNGKIDRNKLLLMVPENNAISDDDLPENYLEMEIFNLWSDLFGLNTFGINDNFFELGGDSIQASHLITAINHKLNSSLSLVDIVKMPTIKLMAKYLKEKSTVTYSPVIVLQKNGKKLPLFCIHPVGGGVLVYATLGLALGEDQPLYAITQLEVKEKSFEQMAERYIKNIKEIQPKGPYHICGWSTGGLIAYEIAHQLEKANEQVKFLGIFDTDLPNHQQQAIRNEYLDLLKRFTGTLERDYKIKLQLENEKLNSLNIQELKHYFQDKLTQTIQSEKINLSPGEFKEINRILSCALNNIQAEAVYQLKQISSDVYFFEAKEHAPPSTHLSEKWKPYTTSDVKVFPIDGNHFSLMSNPYVKQLAEAIASCI